jgi:thymidylate synthase (FAD)
MKAELIDVMGDDLTVVNAARVSFDKASDLVLTKINDEQHFTLSEADQRLIAYLAKHGHWTPFAHPQITIRETVPIFVARQRFKHMIGFVYNEISRRYVDNEPEFYVPDVWRGRSEDKKQGSSNTKIKDILVEGWKKEYPDYLKDSMEVSDAYDSVVNESVLCLYKDLIHAGVCPEQARMVLPQSMMTEWIWSGSLDAFADMCKLRCAPDTQAETAEVAWEIDRKMIDLFPVSWEALREND